MSRFRGPLLVLGCVLLAALLGGCGGTASARGTHGSTASATDLEGGQRFPDVKAVTIHRASDGTYTLTVTISSPYDTHERYADGWRVLDPQGEVLGIHHLSHDHADEQPFTRTMSGLIIPSGTTAVTIQGSDSLAGYGGATVTVQVPSP